MPYSLINSIAGIKLSLLIPVSLSTRMVTKSGTHYIADTVSGTGDIVTNLVETGLWTRVTDVHWNLDGKVMQSEMDSSSREKRKDHEEVMLESFTGHWVRSPECHQNINPVNARVFFFFFWPILLAILSLGPITLPGMQQELNIHLLMEWINSWILKCIPIKFMCCQD